MGDHEDQQVREPNRISGTYRRDPLILVQALRATVGGHRYVTRALAARLVADALGRPMPPRKGLPPHAQDYLDDIMRRGPSLTQRQKLLEEIWQVATDRRAVYHVALTDEDRKILALLELGYTPAAIAAEIGCDITHVHHREAAIANKAKELFDQETAPRVRGGWILHLLHRLNEAIRPNPWR